jgi:hypothetical protein
MGKQREGAGIDMGCVVGRTQLRHAGEGDVGRGQGSQAGEKRNEGKGKMGERPIWVNGEEA